MKTISYTVSEADTVKMNAVFNKEFTRMTNEHKKHPERYSESLDDLELRWAGVAKTIAMFSILEEDGLASIDREQDIFSTASDTFGDMFDHECNPDIPPSQLAKERKRELARVNRNGIWDYVLTVLGTEAEAIGGFVGKDFYGSGYDIDFYNSALEIIKDQMPEYFIQLDRVVVGADFGFNE